MVASRNKKHALNAYGYFHFHFRFSSFICLSSFFQSSFDTEPRRQRHYHGGTWDILASGWMTVDAASCPRSESSVFDSTSTPTGHHHWGGSRGIIGNGARCRNWMKRKTKRALKSALTTHTYLLLVEFKHKWSSFINTRLFFPFRNKEFDVHTWRRLDSVLLLP